ncbi:integrase family protein [Sphingobium aquiterrae]|uniref:tyrosine-type recombinase/integrase n=1 Tax=Sphingobium aquiterrae TaxID=2038656 RepID=UPI0030184D60
MLATQKIELTSFKLDNLPPAQAGSRYEIADALISGLRIRVSDEEVEGGRYRGKASRITFVLLARFPPSHNPTRRAIGTYSRGLGGVTLQRAREIAVEWKNLIRQGIDPAEISRQQRLEEERRRAETEKQRLQEEEAARNRKSLKDVLDRYESEHLAYLARGKATRRALDGEQGLFKDLVDREPASITRSDISQAVKAKVAIAPASANRQLAYAKAFFNWCVDEEILELNPAIRLKKPAKENTRDRYHSVDELREIWAATDDLGYPFAQLFRLLIVVPMRREEIAAMSLKELALGTDEESGSAVWTLPAPRTKNRNALRVPISTLARSLIKEAIDHPDRPAKSDFVFSTTCGSACKKDPVSGVIGV